MSNKDSRETAPASADGPLVNEARSLSRRAQDVHALAACIGTMDDARACESLGRLQPLIAHLAAHGEVEERIVYPYFRGKCTAEVAVLEADHALIRELAAGLARWTPTDGRVALHRLLTDFGDIVSAHLLVEGEVCMPVVHGHSSAGPEQQLFEAVETELFERSVSALRPDSAGQQPR